MPIDDYDEFDNLEDEVAPEGNRLPGATAKAILEYVARAIAERPEEVSVEVIEGPGSVVLELRAAPEDVGRIIGKNGRVAAAMRQLVRAAAHRDGIHASVDILD